MDDYTVIAAIEAQFLMGHRVPGGTLDEGRETITEWHWDEDTVRQALFVPLDATWGERVLELELQGLASFSMYCAPLYWDADGTEHEIAGWQDEPREKWGSLSIHARGVLKLADLYGRPYVRCGESPALFAHWKLVQAECLARLKAPMDEEKFAREYPERARHLRTWLQEDEDGLESGGSDV